MGYTNVAKPTGTPYTNLSKPVDGGTIGLGSYIGPLGLTTSEDFITTYYTNISKPTGTPYTNVSKPT